MAINWQSTYKATSECICSWYYLINSCHICFWRYCAVYVDFNYLHSGLHLPLDAVFNSTVKSSCSPFKFSSRVKWGGGLVLHGWVMFVFTISGSSWWSPAVTQPAPDFKGTAVHNGEFKEISLADFKGKYLVLFFYPLDLWVFVTCTKRTTWCLPFIEMQIGWRTSTEDQQCFGHCWMIHLLPCPLQVYRLCLCR